MLLSYEGANFIGLLVETMFFGILLVSVGYYLTLLLFNSDSFVVKKPDDIKWWAVCVTFCTFAIFTADLMLNIVTNVIIMALTSTQSYPVVESQVPHWIDIVRFVFFIMQAFLADVVLTFRLFVVCGRKWAIRVIVLAVLFLAGAAGALFYIVFVVGHEIWSSEAKLAGRVLLGVDIFFNIIAISLLVCKLWKAYIAVSRISLTPNKWLILIRIILESGLLYIVAEIAVLISVSFGTEVVVCTMNTSIPILIMSSILILIRTHDMPQRVPVASIV